MISVFGAGVLSCLPACKQESATAEVNIQARGVSVPPNVSSSPSAGWPREDADDFNQTFKLVPAGTFQMGESVLGALPVHAVNVPGFYMAETEVRFGEWKSVKEWARDHGYDFSNAGSAADDDKPVASVDWYDAVKWCNARSERAGVKPCYYTEETRSTTEVYRKGRKDLSVLMVDWEATGYRLPTEAEWERAARGGLEGKKFPHGDSIASSDANFSSKAAESVRTYPANSFGLSEMAGNVWEWCWDWFGEDEQFEGLAQDPRGPGAGQRRVARGGGWDDGPGCCSVYYRNGAWPEYSSDARGFRLVRRGAEPREP